MFHMKRLGCSPLHALLNLEALFELAASGVDIVASRVADRGLNTTGLKTTLKVFNLMDRRRLERAALDIVELDQIDVAQRALAEVAECLHLGVCVIDALDHGVFVCRTAAGLFGVELKGLVKAQKCVLLNARHEFIAGGLNGGVQRDGERELLGNVGKLTNTRNNAAGGDGEMTRSDTDSVRVIKDA